MGLHLFNNKLKHMSVNKSNIKILILMNFYFSSPCNDDNKGNSKSPKKENKNECNHFSKGRPAFVDPLNLFFFLVFVTETLLKTQDQLNDKVDDHPNDECVGQS